MSAKRAGLTYSDLDHVQTASGKETPVHASASASETAYKLKPYE